DATLSHFVHIPWPQPDYWRILPEEMRYAIHDGLLANDVVGFHSSRWRLAFLRCAVDIAGAEGNFIDWTADYRGRQTRVDASPISIDPEEFDELAESPAVLEAEHEIVERRPERLIVRVDRTDPSKNVVAKEGPLVNTRDGVVVLSENAGVCEELGSWALTVNPFDVAAQAEAIHEALEMPVTERRDRLEAIRAHVREHDLAHWLASQL